MKSSDRKRIKRQLTNIAKHVEERMPLWTICDSFTCDLMRDAVKAIEDLEQKTKK